MSDNDNNSDNINMDSSSDDESGGRPPAYSRTYNPADLTKAMDYMARKPKATIRKVAVLVVIVRTWPQW